MFSVAPLILMSCACCPHLEPEAPYTSRAVESEWGEPFNGLSILAATDARSVQLGARLTFEVFFRFHPFYADRVVTSLNAEARKSEITLLLTSTLGAGLGDPANVLPALGDFGAADVSALICTPVPS